MGGQTQKGLNGVVLYQTFFDVSNGSSSRKFPSDCQLWIFSLFNVSVFQCYWYKNLNVKDVLYILYMYHYV